MFGAARAKRGVQAHVVNEFQGAGQEKGQTQRGTLDRGTRQDRAAGLAAAGLSLSIALLMGEQLPTITPGRALTTAIPVELLLVPLGIAVAWMEFGRFRVLHRAH